jgi:hypothetical protein
MKNLIKILVVFLAIGAISEAVMSKVTTTSSTKTTTSDVVRGSKESEPGP